jgi:hypothetical protein
MRRHVFRVCTPTTVKSGSYEGAGLSLEGAKLQTLKLLVLIAKTEKEPRGAEGGSEYLPYCFVFCPSAELLPSPPFCIRKTLIEATSPGH